MPKLLHPIIIKLYLLRNELYFLEKELDKNNDSAQLYDNIMITTDNFHRVRDKAVKIYITTEAVDNMIFYLDKICGET